MSTFAANLQFKTFDKKHFEDKNVQWFSKINHFQPKSAPFKQNPKELASLLGQYWGVGF